MSAEELSDSQVELLHRQLLEQKAQLIRQVTSAQSTTRPVTLDQQSVGRVSRIDAIQQQQMAIASQTNAEQLVNRINLAITRIENDEYGFCISCEEPIGFPRLQAQPFTGLCLACQERAENK